MLEDRVYLELQLSKSVQTDANGNYIIEAEASNEDLDFQGQVVLQRALLDSKDYFLKNGVISWDHLHKRKDDKGAPITDPEFIIGEPMGVEKRGAKTFVKALLYKGNRIAEDIVSKLRSGATTIKTSVGGVRPVIQKSYDSKLGKAVEKIVSVLWDELALTYKPVLQTLAPVTLSSAAFVKSLQLGYGTDSAGMTGGRSIVPQDLDGDKKKQAMKALIVAVAAGDVMTPEAGRAVLGEYGITDKEADAMLEELVNRRDQAKGAFKMDETLTKSFDEAVDELEKALKKGTPPVPPMPAENNDGKDPLFQAKPKMGENEEEDEDEDEDDEGGEGNEGGEENLPPPPVPVKKSQDFDEDMDFIDVSPVLESMTKSIQSLTAEVREVRKENRALRKSLAEQDAMLKSIGNAQVQSAKLLKSMGDQPEMRKSVVAKQGRNFLGADGKTPITMGREEILAKSTLALGQGKITLRDASIIEDRLNKGLDIPAPTLEMLKSIT